MVGKYVKPLDLSFFEKTENCRLTELKERFASIEYDHKSDLFAVRMLTFTGALYVKVNEKAVEMSVYNRDTRREIAFELSDLGWKQDEIAMALGITQATVSMWLSAVRDSKNGKTDS